MTDLTPEEILEAIRRGLEKTWRRIDEEKRQSQLREHADESIQQGPPSNCKE